MNNFSYRGRYLRQAVSASVLSITLILGANAQTPPPSTPEAGATTPATPAARQGVSVRKAVYTLIGDNFKPIGAILKGGQYNAPEVQKSVTRILYLSDEAGETFGPNTNLGEPETKAKSDIWTNHADFEKKLKDFQSDAIKLAQVNEADKGATEAFKAAAGAVAQDCKACHDSFRAK